MTKVSIRIIQAWQSFDKPIQDSSRISPIRVQFVLGLVPRNISDADSSGYLAIKQTILHSFGISQTSWIYLMRDD